MSASEYVRVCPGATVTDAVWTYEQLKWLVHWYFVNGIDLLILHLCYLNPDEGGAGILHNADQRVADAQHLSIAYVLQA